MFVEFANSPTYGGSQTELSAVRRGICAWSDITALFAQLFPASFGGFPVFPALFPGSNVLFAQHVTFQPFPNNNAIITGVSPVNSYSWAEVEIEYKTIPYQQSSTGGSILTRRGSATGEFMTLPNLRLEWATGTKAVKNPELFAGKMIGMESWTITRHRVANPLNKALFRGLRGKVNDTQFEEFPAETLLFMGADYQQTLSYQGDDSWQVDLHFVSRNIDGETSLGWNHFFNSEVEPPAWDRLQLKGGEKIYRTGNFNLLY